MRIAKLVVLMSYALLQHIGIAQAATITVPGDFPTVESAVTNAAPGDVIVIAPGTYQENHILINKPLTITSQWFTSGDPQFINQTIMDGGGGTVFETVENEGVGVEISGLKFVNSRKPVILNDLATIKNNTFTGNSSDCISFERPASGFAGFNTIEDCSDDGIDVDAAAGTITIEHNIIRNNGDDGVEIRLVTNPDPDMEYRIHDNIITGSDEDAIQLIDQSDGVDTRVFYIYNNVLANSTFAGLGSMPNGNTIEDLNGSDMKEKVVFYNNTVTGNAVGITGADNFIAINNIIANNTSEGVKRFRLNSVVAHSIFYSNGTHISDAITSDGILLDIDPQFDPATYELLQGSPSIDAGVAFFMWQGQAVIDLDQSAFIGLAPDLGAGELGGPGNGRNLAPSVDAGDDQAVFEPTDFAILEGAVSDDGLPNGVIDNLWTTVTGPGEVAFTETADPMTTATFSLQGQYQLRLTAGDGELTASDSIVVRHARQGSGDVVSVAPEGTTFFEAESFAYLYGTAEVISDPDASDATSISAPGGLGTLAFTEHSLLVAQQDVSYYVWVRGRGFNDNTSSVSVSFRDSTPVEISFPSNVSYGWSRLVGSFLTAAGNWPLIIQATEGGVVWDRVAFTTDPDFAPSMMADITSQGGGGACWWWWLAIPAAVGRRARRGS